jgi:hypothetical protein
LRLAKLYQSTGSPVDAHDVLRPRSKALRRPRKCRIAEGQALFAALAEAHEVKAETTQHALDACRRQRMFVGPRM